MMRWLWAIVGALVIVGLGWFFWPGNRATVAPPTPPPAAQAPAASTTAEQAPAPAVQAPAASATAGQASTPAAQAPATTTAEQVPAPAAQAPATTTAEQAPAAAAQAPATTTAEQAPAAAAQAPAATTADQTPVGSTAGPAPAPAGQAPTAATPEQAPASGAQTAAASTPLPQSAPATATAQAPAASTPEQPSAAAPASQAPGGSAGEARDAEAAANDKATNELASLKPGFVPKDLTTALNDSVINFPTGSAEVPASIRRFLENAASDLKQVPKGYALEIAGYTDNTGDAAINREVSQRRADAVREVLVKAGANPDMLLAKGYGSADPIASNDTPEGRQRNRRIEYRIVKEP